MPNLSKKCRFVSSKFISISEIAISDFLTAPKNGTAKARISTFNGHSSVRVGMGFSGGLADVATVNDLRQHIAAHWRVQGDCISYKQVVALGNDGRSMHGRKRLQ